MSPRDHCTIGWLGETDEILERSAVAETRLVAIELYHDRR